MMRLALLACVVALAASPPAVGEDLFVSQVQPIFKRHCWKCHNSATRKGELELTSAAGIRRGSESGPILAARPDDSRLLEVLVEGEMPPDGEGRPLTEEEIGTIRRWIESGGAPGPDDSRPPQRHQVQAILLRHCATCHGRQQQEGGLDIRSIESLMRGGKSGPAVVAGDATGSLLLKRIRDEQMPPREKLASHSIKPVEAGDLALLERWIASGASWEAEAVDAPGADGDPLVSDADRQHWAFLPPRHSRPPATEHWRHPVDAFLHKAMRQRQLDPAPPAERQALVRRLYFDLLGLPPSPEELAAALADRSPLAYQRLVDRLLASPAYGERWGQYWLDLAGYADSEGVQHADPLRPHAYRYRDYVIQSLNEDKPYDRFLVEQLAGDELDNYEDAAEITPQLYDQLVATGFLRMTSDGTFAGITGFLPNRLDVIDDQIRVLSSSVMGLTIRCARCHSHKFDPIPQRDYYRLAAVFKGAMDEYDWLKPLQAPVGSSRYLPHVTTAERPDRWEAGERRIDEQIAALKQRQQQLQVDQKEGEQKKAAEAKHSELAEQIKQLESQRTPEPMIRALWDAGEPSPTFLLRRGDYRQAARVVGPGVPSVLTDGRMPFRSAPPWPGAKKTGNRLALARWLTRPHHPLTARVIVNRTWKHHFGRGLVEPLDDFGKAGGKPTHPQLLDWLAVRLSEHQWSLKKLHRLLLTSAAYRRSSFATEEQLRRDPDNLWLARMPLRRMDAELLRDSLIAVAGRLDRRQFGPAAPVEARDDGLVVSVSQAGAWRRSIYVTKRRTQRLTILDNFDRPRMSPNCVDRPLSNVAPQALHLMNNAMIHQLSLALAARVAAEAGDDPRRQVDRLFSIAAGRQPSELERDACLQSLAALSKSWQDRKSDGDRALRPLANVCHVMLNSAVFLHID